MILTGPELRAEVERGRITIDDFDDARIEPNSYGFRLASHLIVHADEELDAAAPPRGRHEVIPEDGVMLYPGRLYLGATAERMGSPHYAATLYARRSVSTMGMWIQASAPLGHMGAIIPWTLEIRVAQRTVVYPGMCIGKIAFWAPVGRPLAYAGKYRHSRTATPSRLSDELVDALVAQVVA